MQLTRPKVRRVHITAYDRDARKTKTMTVYQSTVDEVFSRIQAAVSDTKTNGRKAAAAS